MVIPAAPTWFRPDTGEDNPDSWSSVQSINHAGNVWLNLLGKTVPTFLALDLLSAVFRLGILAFRLVNRVTAPLDDMAWAARRLGCGVMAAPLSEEGPAGVRTARCAFNAVRTRLIRQIEGGAGMLAAITQIHLRAKLSARADNRNKILGTPAEMETIIGPIFDFSRAAGDNETRPIVALGSPGASISDDFADEGTDIALNGPEGVRYLSKRLAMTGLRIAKPATRHPAVGR